MPGVYSTSPSRASVHEDYVLVEWYICKHMYTLDSKQRYTLSRHDGSYSLASPLLFTLVLYHICNHMSRTFFKLSAVAVAVRRSWRCRLNCLDYTAYAIICQAEICDFLRFVDMHSFIALFCATCPIYRFLATCFKALKRFCPDRCKGKTFTPKYIS